MQRRGRTSRVSGARPEVRLRWALLLLLGVLAVAAPAQAATRTVVLDQNGPSPALGDDQRRRQGGLRQPRQRQPHDQRQRRTLVLPTRPSRAGGRRPRPAVHRAGHYGYNDAFVVAVFQQNVDGSIEVRAAAPAPRRSPPLPRARRRSRPPRASPSASPAPRPHGSPAATRHADADAHAEPVGCSDAHPGHHPPVPVADARAGTARSPRRRARRRSPTGRRRRSPSRSAHRYGLPVAARPAGRGRRAVAAGPLPARPARRECAPHPVVPRVTGVEAPTG